MSKSNMIIDMMKKNNGVITSSQITRAGFSRSSISTLLNKGLIERSERGVYILPEVFDDDLFNTQQKYKKGIYSLETALFLHGLTDRTPNRYSMYFPASYNTSNVDKSKINSKRVKLDLYDLGIINVTTPGGNIVRSYNVEKTLCDILRSRNRVDIQIISEAFKTYIFTKNINIVLLSEYSKKLNVEEKVRSYLEVLL